MRQEIDYSLLPLCCDSGCTVCVKDYPELYWAATVEEKQTMAMLEAIEQAELEAAEFENK